MTIENTPENIKKLRKKIGLTQTECGEIFGVGLSTWQKKKLKPTTSLIYRKVNLSTCYYLQGSTLNTSCIKS